MSCDALKLNNTTVESISICYLQNETTTVWQIKSIWINYRSMRGSLRKIRTRVNVKNDCVWGSWASRQDVTFIQPSTQKIR